jgi:drug/metabolite transporter (DMT)-like permease
MFAVVYGLAVVLAITVTTTLWGETKAAAGWLGLLVVSVGLLILVLGSSSMRHLLEDLMNGEW